MASREAANPVISILQFGAVPNGERDSAAAIQRAFDEAKARSVPVYIPAGRFRHSKALVADGIKIFGSGPTSVLFATNPKSSALFLRGASPAVADLALETAAGPRLDKLEENAVTVDRARNFSIKRLYIQSSAAAGIHVFGATGGRIESCAIQNTNADAIHISNTDRGEPSSDIVVERNKVEHSGDDGIAVVSYGSNDTRNFSITVRNNSVANNRWGRGYSVVGGRNINIIDNYYENNLAGFAGIYLASEPAYQTGSVNGVRVAGNVVRNAGGRHGAIHIYSGQPSLENSDIQVVDNTILHPRWGWLVVNGTGGNRAIFAERNAILSKQFGEVMLLDRPAQIAIEGNRALTDAR